MRAALKDKPLNHITKDKTALLATMFAFKNFKDKLKQNNEKKM